MTENHHRPFIFHKWGVVKGCNCREERTKQVTRYWPVRYSMP